MLVLAGFPGSRITPNQAPIDHARVSWRSVKTAPLGEGGHVDKRVPSVTKGAAHSAAIKHEGLCVFLEVDFFLNYYCEVDLFRYFVRIEWVDGFKHNTGAFVMIV